MILEGVEILKPIIFDVDTGIDDAMAMAYALNSPELEVLGFTTCFGNVPVVESTRNTLAVLEKLNRRIPVFEGADQTLVRGRKKKYPKHVHGEDGLGNTLQFEPSIKAFTRKCSRFHYRSSEKPTA